MIKLVQHNTLEDFFNFNKHFLLANKGCFIATLNLLFKGNPDVQTLGFFNIVDDEKEIFIYGLIANSNTLSINGFKWNHEVIELVSQHLRLDKLLPDRTFSGNKELIQELLKFNNVKYVERKSRIIYRCTKVNDKAKPNPILGTMTSPVFDDYEELIEMSRKFQKEETGKDETDDSAIQGGLIKGNILIWTKEKKIKSMIQIMHDYEHVRIGHYFTNRNHRRKGYGKALLYKATKKLLIEFDQVTLESIEGYLPSNRSFISVGYEPIYRVMTVDTL